MEFVGAYNKFFVSAQRHIDAVLPYVAGRQVAVQAGGHSGCWPVYLASKFERVYTWEPASYNFTDMVRNIQTAGYIDKVFCARGLLGNKGGMADISGNSGSTRRVIGTTGQHPVYRLDDIRLPVCDLIYLDVEDDELLILHGSADTLDRCKPVVVVEERGGFEGKGGVAKFLDAYGYEHIDTYCNDLIFRVRV